MKENMTANTIDGSRSPTGILLPKVRLIPTPKIKTEPTSERLDIAPAVITWVKSLASSVTEPCSRITGNAEKMQPMPIEAAMTRMITKSKIALVIKIE